ncbi:hypothetical protein MMC07_006494 [Pseudocyphellaria aurata]|nr:hypothetical protein [Pseudocyphellaria aurata]
MLRVVHNFIPLNEQTIRLQHPMHRIEEVVETVMQPKFFLFFSSDATAAYWAVPMKSGHEYKTGVVTPHGHYAYLRMGMGLVGASQTYVRLGDLTFGHLPATESVTEQPTILRDHGDAGFAIFADDHVGAARDFDAMFTFLHSQFFPRCAFGPIYLVPRKTFMFVRELDFMGFTRSLRAAAIAKSQKSDQL